MQPGPEITTPPPGLSGEEDAAKRRILLVLSLILIAGGVLVAVTMPIVGIEGEALLLEVAGSSVIALIGAIVYVLVQRGQILPGGYILVALLIAGPSYYVFLEGPKTVATVLFLAGVALADRLIGGRSGLIVATIDSLLYLGFGLAYHLGWITATVVSALLTDIGTVVISTYGMALVTGFFAQAIQRALDRTREREAALRLADEEHTRLLAELRNREDAQQHLLDAVRELGSPVIPLAEGVIAMPLIGTIDSERALHVTESLLQGVAAHRASVAIVDITGVPVVDTAVAGALIQAMAGVRLLGAEAVLTGIRSEVAQTMVTLGLDLSGVVTRATIQEGLAYALAGEEE